MPDRSDAGVEPRHAQNLGYNSARIVLSADVRVDEYVNLIFKGITVRPRWFTSLPCFSEPAGGGLGQRAVGPSDSIARRC
jgi:hypothetical protein